MSGRDGEDVETAWIEVTIVTATAGAVLVQERPPVWIPKSKIVDFAPVGHKDRLDDLEGGDKTKFELPVWLIEVKGIDSWVCDP